MELKGNVKANVQKIEAYTLHNTHFGGKTIFTYSVGMGEIKPLIEIGQQIKV